MQADKIVDLHKGKVQEEGTHNYNYKFLGYYFSLWEYQMPEVERLEHNRTQLNT